MISLKIDEEIKTKQTSKKNFSDKQKITEFITTKPALKQTLKGLT